MTIKNAHTFSQTSGSYVYGDVYLRGRWMVFDLKQTSGSGTF